MAPSGGRSPYGGPVSNNSLNEAAAYAYELKAGVVSPRAGRLAASGTAWCMTREPWLRRAMMSGLNMPRPWPRPRGTTRTKRRLILGLRARATAMVNTVMEVEVNITVNQRGRPVGVNPPKFNLAMGVNTMGVTPSTPRTPNRGSLRMTNTSQDSAMKRLMIMIPGCPGIPGMGDMIPIPVPNPS